MGDDSVYAYNNMIVITSVVVVSVIMLTMSFVFLLLLLRRKRMEKRRQRAENSANVNHGHIPDYVDEEPQRLAVIGEYSPKARIEPKNVFEGQSDKHLQPTIGDLPLSNESEQIPSPSSAAAPYHFTFNGERMLDVDDIVSNEEAHRVMRMQRDMGENSKQVEDAESDSDYDATFETVVS